MDRFQDNTRTQYVIDSILEMDVDASEEISDTEFWKNLESQTLFRDGINMQLVRVGYHGEADDTHGKVKFITEQFKKHTITPISEPTLKNWLTASAPDDNEKSREKVYQLCFALEMNAVKTAEFFFKSYLTRPFNYKDTAEAAYYWCLLNGKGYADATRLITEIESAKMETRVDRDMATEELGSEISYIKDEAELVRYLAEHRYEKAEQHMTVTDRISELLERCYKSATLEMPYIKEKPRTVDNADILLDTIYDFDAAQMDTTIAKSRFPKALKANWPNRQTFENIKKHNIGAEDAYRKALILLVFYDFYASTYVAQRATKNDIEVDMIGLTNEFLTELDETLAECGYVQIYPRNPFDGLIYFCTAYPNPLAQFRQAIAEFYLDDADPTEA